MQPQDKNNKNLQRLGILAIVFVLAIIGLSIYRSFGFHVVSTNPSSNAVSAVTPFFNVSFNKPLTSTGVVVTSKPQIISAYKVNGKTLEIALSGLLQLRTTYRITIVSIADTSGHHLSNKVFTFSPKDISYANLPQDQQQAILRAQTNYTAMSPQNDPIVNHLPYGGLDFNLSVVGNANQPPLSLNADLLLSAADARSGPDAELTAINHYRQEVTKYIQSLGLDPNKYNIHYNVIQPTL